MPSLGVALSEERIPIPKDYKQNSLLKWQRLGYRVSFLEKPMSNCLVYSPYAPAYLIPLIYPPQKLWFRRGFHIFGTIGGLLIWGAKDLWFVKHGSPYAWRNLWGYGNDVTKDEPTAWWCAWYTWPSGNGCNHNVSNCSWELRMLDWGIGRCLVLIAVGLTMKNGGEKG